MNKLTHFTRRVVGHARQRTHEVDWLQFAR